MRTLIAANFKFLELFLYRPSLLCRGFYSFKEYEFEGIEIALEGIWYEDNR
jgi:hypothetical protein